MKKIIFLVLLFSTTNAFAQLLNVEQINSTYKDAKMTFATDAHTILQTIKIENGFLAIATKLKGFTVKYLLIEMDENGVITKETETEGMGYIFNTLSADGKMLASAKYDYTKKKNTVHIINVSDMKELKQFEFNETKATDYTKELKFSPDGKFLAGTLLKGQSYIWNMTELNMVWFNPKETPIHSIAFSTYTSEAAVFYEFDKKDFKKISKFFWLLMVNLTDGTGKFYDRPDRLEIADAHFKKDGKLMLLTLTATITIYDLQKDEMVKTQPLSDYVPKAMALGTVGANGSIKHIKTNENEYIVVSLAKNAVTMIFKGEEELKPYIKFYNPREQEKKQNLMYHIGRVEQFMVGNQVWDIPNLLNINKM